MARSLPDWNPKRIDSDLVLESARVAGDEAAPFGCDSGRAE
jgi:hypothetical protein